MGAGLIDPRTPSPSGEKGTGVPLGLRASGDGRHPGGAVGPPSPFSVFPELGSLEGWAARGRRAHPWLLRALAGPQPLLPPPPGPARSRPEVRPVGPGTWDSTHEPGPAGGGPSACWSALRGSSSGGLIARRLGGPGAPRKLGNPIATRLLIRDWTCFLLYGCCTIYGVTSVGPWLEFENP